MKTKIQKAIIGGTTGSLVMTIIMLVAPMMGMPEMNPAEMLSEMMGVPIFLGWIMHFMTGVIFAMGYVFFLSQLLNKINSRIIKGAAFGIVVFIFAQIMMVIIESVMGAIPSPETNMVLMFIGSIMGHLVYGIVTITLVEMKSFSNPVAQPLEKLQA